MNSFRISRIIRAKVQFRACLTKFPRRVSSEKQKFTEPKEPPDKEQIPKECQPLKWQ
ncbi:MAG: hypothetical protein P1V20_26705 [Verrucomicrobiales bacterium]|nr:hypothetical protein [Verrucomicrobiales bacterium]